jgi:hypothetical protein
MVLGMPWEEAELTPSSSSAILGYRQELEVYVDKRTGGRGQRYT